MTEQPSDLRLEELEKLLLAESQRRVGEAIARQWRRPGGVPWIIIDQGDDADRERQLAALGNPEFAIVWEMVRPPDGGVLPGMRPADGLVCQ
jgi:hypothetical protein